MIISHDPHISNLMYYKKELLGGLKRMLRMHERKYDAIVDMTFGKSVTATILLNLVGPGAFKLGVGKDRLRRIIDATVPDEDVEGPQIIRITVSLVKPFGIDLDECDLIPRMYLVEKYEEKAKEFLAPIRSSHDMLVGINLSAGRPARTWPLERYIEFLSLLRSEYPDAAVILSAAPNERSKMDEVMRMHSDNVYTVPRGYSIREIAGLLKHLDFLLTPDISIGHIASCVELPSLAMYPGNMENFEVWRPSSPCVRAINSPDYCRIEYLPAEPVFKAFRALIEDKKREQVSSRE